jgi:hypothetical protein
MWLLSIKPNRTKFSTAEKFQMKVTYDFDKIIALVGTSCAKWDSIEQIFGEKDLLPMWVADKDIAVLENSAMIKIACNWPDRLKEASQSWEARRAYEVVPTLFYCRISFQRRRSQYH